MLARRLGLVSSETNEADDGVVIRVAAATRDGRRVDAHFGSAPRFAVFDVSANQQRFVETISFESLSDESGDHKKEGDDNNGAKIKALAGVQVLLVQAIGGPVASRVIAAKIHPIKIAEPQPIPTLLAEFQEMLKKELPPWLRRILPASTEDRDMGFLDDDDD